MMLLVKKCSACRNEFLTAYFNIHNCIKNDWETRAAEIYNTTPLPARFFVQDRLTLPSPSKSSPGVSFYRHIVERVLEPLSISERVLRDRSNKKKHPDLIDCFQNGSGCSDRSSNSLRETPGTSVSYCTGSIGESPASHVSVVQRSGLKSDEMEARQGKRNFVALVNDPKTTMKPHQCPRVTKSVGNKTEARSILSST